MTINSEFRTKWCSILTVLTPLFMMYYIGISTITLLDISIVTIYFVFFVLDYYSGISLKVDGYKKILVILITYILFTYILNICIRNLPVVDVLLRTGRYILYLSWPIVICGKYFDEEYAFKIYRNICVFATIWLILQYVFLVIYKISIPGYVPFFKLARPELREFTENLQMTAYARPRSIFAEPSQYGIYVSVYLSILLLKKKNQFNIPLFVFLIFGLMISSSTTAYFGIILCMLLIIRNILTKPDLRVTKSKAILMLGGIILLLFIIVSKGKEILFIINRAYVRMPTSFNNRIEGYTLMLAYLKNYPLVNLIFGIGMDVNVLNSIIWTASMVKIIYYFGVLGVLILLMICVGALLKFPKEKSYLLLIIVFMGFFTEILVSNWMVLFLPFIYPQIKQIKLTGNAAAHYLEQSGNCYNESRSN